MCQENPQTLAVCLITELLWLVSLYQGFSLILQRYLLFSSKICFVFFFFYYLPVYGFLKESEENHWRRFVFCPSYVDRNPNVEIQLVNFSCTVLVYNILHECVMHVYHTLLKCFSFILVLTRAKGFHSFPPPLILMFWTPCFFSFVSGYKIV